MKADRDITKLENNFKLKVLDFMADKRIQALGVFITEGFRTYERQEWLYSSGRTRDGAIVTWTKWGMHNEGKAIDIACNKGQLYPSDLQWWKNVYKIAAEYGIDSLYELHGVDKPHLQENGEKYKPNQTYKDNQNIMENLKEEFGEKVDESLRALISAARKSSDDPVYKEKLAELGAYMDSKIK